MGHDEYNHSVDITSKILILLNRPQASHIKMQKRQTTFTNLLSIQLQQDFEASQIFSPKLDFN